MNSENFDSFIKVFSDDGIFEIAYESLYIWKSIIDDGVRPYIRKQHGYGDKAHPKTPNYYHFYVDVENDTQISLYDDKWLGDIALHTLNPPKEKSKSGKPRSFFSDNVHDQMLRPSKQDSIGLRKKKFFLAVYFWFHFFADDNTFAKNIDFSIQKVNPNLSKSIQNVIRKFKAKNDAKDTLKPQSNSKKEDEISHIKNEKLTPEERDELIKKVARLSDAELMYLWREENLFSAVWKRNIQEVKNLLNIGVDINAVNGKGESSLLQVCGVLNASHAEIVKTLIMEGADVNHKDFLGNTPLIVAAANEYDDSGHIIKLMIDKGADVNHQNSDGYTALCYAAEYFSVMNMHALIKAGADVNHQSKFGNAPLHFVSFGFNPWNYAINVLIEAGANLNIVNKENWTPLMRASTYDSGNENVKALLKAGALVNRNNEDFSALICASKFGAKNNTVALLEAGAKIHHTTNEGKTALFYAKKNQHKEVEEALINAGATH